MNKSVEYVVDAIMTDIPNIQSFGYKFAHFDDDTIEKIKKNWSLLIEGEENPKKAIDVIINNLIDEKIFGAVWANAILSKEEPIIRKIWIEIFKNRHEITQQIQNKFPEIRRQKMMKLDAAYYEELFNYLLGLGCPQNEIPKTIFQYDDIDIDLMEKVIYYEFLMDIVDVIRKDVEKQAKSLRAILDRFFSNLGLK